MLGRLDVSKLLLIGFVLFIVPLIMLISGPQEAQAATITVSTSDAGDLIAAINTANGTPDDDVIELNGACTYTIIVPATTFGGLPDITDVATSGTLTINGNGATILRDAAAPEFSVVRVSYYADLTLDDVTISGGISSTGGGVWGWRSTITISNSTLSDNAAPGSGGAIYCYDCTVAISNSTITDNYASKGGGVYCRATTLTITNSTISDNSGGTGSGVYNDSTVAVIAGSTVSGNTGGGIRNESAHLTLTNSTITNNSSGISAGGIGNYDTSTAIIANSTIANNYTETGGGGIVSFFNSTTTITNSTIANNHARIDGGGISVVSGTVTIGNTIIAGNSAQTGPDIDGYVNSDDYNLVQDTTGAAFTGNASHSIFGVDPLLGPLQDNGGPTYTMELFPGSPAIDAGSCLGGEDQRGSGYNRPIDITHSRFPNPDNGCDIGAFELQSLYTYAADDLYSMNVGETLTVSYPGILANDIEPDELALTVTSIDTPPTHAQSFTWNADGSFSYIPQSEWEGTDSFTYTATGPSGWSSASVIISVEPAVEISCVRAELITAIEEANAAGETDDIINLHAGCLYNLISPYSSDNGLPIIEGTLTIHGNGATIRRQSTSPQFRILHVGENADLTLDNITIRGGDSLGSGGGIFNDRGTLTIANSTITSNAATGTFAIYSDHGSVTIANSSIEGNLDGGIFNDYSTVFITDSTIADNQYGGISSLSSNVMITSSTISGNTILGGVHNGSADGTLTLTNSTITNNTGINGGGVSNALGTVTLNNSTVYGNSATELGGGIRNFDGTLNLSSSIVAGNSSVLGSPDIDGTVTSQDFNLIQDTTGATINGTTTSNIYGVDPLPGPLNDNGGPTLTMALLPGSPAIGAGGECGLETDQRGVYLRDLICDIGAYDTATPFAISSCYATDLIAAITLANSTLDDEVIELNGACTYTLTAEDNPNNGLPVIADAATGGTLTINGNGATITRDDAAPQFRILEVATGGDLTLDNVTLSNGDTTSQGGGIYCGDGNLTITNSSILNNTAADSGGGIRLWQCSLTVSDSTIADNSAIASSGGGINIYSSEVDVINSTIANNSALSAAGGGIGGTRDVVLTVTNSTISGNSSRHAGGISTGGVLTVTNSTIAGNSASGSIGAINLNARDTSATITSSTIFGNSADDSGGIRIMSEFDQTLYLGSSIVAGNSSRVGGPDIDGHVNSLGHNLVQDLYGATFTGLIGIFGVSPTLGPLQDNGGSTHTMALLPGSRGINGGGDCGVVTDQRGFLRGNPCDVGAYEIPESITVSTCDANELITAINIANSTTNHDVIDLNGTCTYTLTAEDNPDNGLPVIADATTSGILIVNGFGATIMRDAAAPQFRILQVANGGNLMLNNLTISGGDSLGNGGGIYNDHGILKVNDSTVANNTATGTFAIFNDHSSMTITNSSIADNPQGGIGSVSSNVTISGSTISGNSTLGGIHNGSADGTLTLTNSTIANNSSINGGGISNQHGTVTVTNSTIVGNTATESGGGIRNFEGTITLISTLVAGNSSVLNGPDIDGTVTSQDHNLIQDTTGATISGATTHNIYGIAPLLGPLQDNDGPTQTMALPPDSPAVDTGGECGLETDQRGNHRGLYCDIGAYEIPEPIMVPTCEIHELFAAINLANSSPSSDVIELNGTCIYYLRSAYRPNAGLPIIADAATSGPLTINGNGAIIARHVTATSFGILRIDNGGDLTLDNITLSDGDSLGHGGAIQGRSVHLTLTESTLTNNVADKRGGAIYLIDGSLTITNSSISDNTAGEYGGGICIAGDAIITVVDSSISGNSAPGRGGGISTGSNLVSIVNSTVSDNSSDNSGGGIYAFGDLTISGSTISDNIANSAGGAISTAGVVTMTNSTVSGNTASRGGAFFLSSTTSVLNLTSSTISGNSATSTSYGGGGIYANAYTIVNLASSIVAGNSSAGNRPDIYGPVNSLDHNLIQDTDGATITGTVTHNIYGVDPLLGPLQDNGGPTYTMELLPGSPAIDAGNCSTTEDQRGDGFPRPVDFTQPYYPNAENGCDIGAFELQELYTYAFNDIYEVAAEETLNVPAPGILGNDIEPDGLPLTVISIDTPPAHAQLFTWNADGAFSYTPDIGWYGMDSFSYTAEGPGGLSSATVTIWTGMDLTIPCDTAQLITAIDSANLITQVNNTINLTADCVYTLTAANNPGNGLPVISTMLTINGNDATIMRDVAAPRFRILDIENSGDLILDNVTLSNGDTDSMGAGIRSSGGNITLTNSTISGNSTDLYGGGIHISDGSLTIIDSTISGNSGHGSGGIFAAYGPVIITNSSITSNSVVVDGGGIQLFDNTLVTITGSHISGNFAGDAGGGIRNGYGPLNVANSTIAGNSAGRSGGGIYNLGGNTTISNSTLSGNSADSAGGAINNGGVVTVTNSTIANNTAERGGGIRLSSTGAVANISSSTIAGNSATSTLDGGGGIYTSGYTVNIENSVVAGNNSASYDGPDIYGAINSLDYNLIQDTTGTIVNGTVTHNIYGVDPLLGPLQDNGGPTFTMALLPGSPALNAGGLCGLETDQRGVDRGQTCDIGAYEGSQIITISERELFDQMQTSIASHPNIQTIDFVLADFTTDAIHFTVRTIDDTVGEVMVVMADNTGYVTITFASITVDGDEPPAAYLESVNRELPILLLTSLDTLIMAKTGIATPDLYGATINDTVIVIEL